MDRGATNPLEVPLMSRLRQFARHMKRELHALVLALKHPATPWYARFWSAGIVVYALSPIDLIPDIIPVLGALDDLIIVPLGIALAVRLIPTAVLAECRAQATDEPLPRHWWFALVMVALWLLAAWLVWRWIV